MTQELKPSDEHQLKFLLPNALPKSGDKMVLLDSNVIAQVILPQSDLFNVRLCKLIESHGYNRGRDFALGTTPFHITERLAVKHPKCPIIPVIDKYSLPSDIIEQFVRAATDYFISRNEYATATLLEAANKQALWLTGYGRYFFDACIVKQIKKDNFIERLAYGLAWDHVMQFNFGPHSNRVANVLSTMILVLDYPEISRFRLTKRLWDQFYKQRHVLTENSRAVAELVNPTMRLKSKADFLDCDLIHAACFGYHLDRDVLVITCDPPDSIEGRLTVYKSIITAIASRIVGEFELRDVINGYIMCIDSHGTLLREIDVQKVKIVLM